MAIRSTGIKKSLLKLFNKRSLLKNPQQAFFIAKIFNKSPR